MYELAEEEGEGTDIADEELADLRADIDALEVTTMLSGEYDSREALINIRSGAGASTPQTGPKCSCACIFDGPKNRDAK